MDASTASDGALAPTPRDGRTTSRVRALALGFFPSVVTSLIGPFLALHLVGERQFGVQAVAMVVGASQLLNALLGLASGHLVDRIDRLLAARAGLLAMAVLPAALLLQAPLPALFGALLVYGLGCSLFDHAASTTIYAGSDAQCAREAYSYYYAAHNGGVLLSPLVVYLTGAAGQRETFAVAAALHGAVLAWSLFGTRRSAATAAAAPRMRAGWRAPLLAPLPALVAFGLCYSLTYSQFFSTLSVALEGVQLFERPLYPLLVAVNGALVVLSQQIYLPLSRRHGSRRLLLAGAALLLAGYTVLAVSASQAAAVLLFAVLFSLAEVLINLSATDLVLGHAPEGARASWLSIYQTSRLSGGPGAMAGGALLAAHGAQALPLAFAATVLPMLLIAYALRRGAAHPASP